MANHYTASAARPLVNSASAAVWLAGTALHEFTHDARHLLGFPCH